MAAKEPLAPWPYAVASRNMAVAFPARAARRNHPAALRPARAAAVAAAEAWADSSAEARADSSTEARADSSVAAPPPLAPSRGGRGFCG